MASPLNERALGAAGAELERALADRESNPEAAIAALTAAAERIDIRDADLMAWLAEACRPRIPDGLRPIFDRAVHGPALIRRQALHKLGVTSWYDGEPEAAESYWQELVQGTSDAPDLLHWKSLNNLSLIRFTESRSFESLVLAESVVRAQLADQPMVTGFAHANRARALMDLEPAAALAAAREGLELCPPSASKAAHGSLQASEVDALLALGQWGEAEPLAEALVESLAGLAPDAVKVSQQCKRTRIRYELYPERRDALMAELDALFADYELTGKWVDALGEELHFLRWRHAVERRDTTQARRDSAHFIEASRGAASAARIDQVLALMAELPLGEPTSHRVLEGLADAILSRFGQTVRERESVRGLAAATESDWQLFARYQRSLLSERPRLYPHMASLWRPGLPAYDELMATGVVVQCAWCGRLRSGDRWLAAQDVIRLVAAHEVSHGICPDCAARQQDD